MKKVNKKYLFLGDSFLGTRHGENYVRGETKLDIPEIPYFFKKKLNLSDEQLEIQYMPGESSHILCNHILYTLDTMFEKKEDLKNLVIIFSVPTSHRHRFTQISSWGNWSLFNFTFRKLFDETYKNEIIPEFDKKETEIIKDIYDRNLVDVGKMWAVELICIIKVLEHFGVNFVLYKGREHGAEYIPKYFKESELKYVMWKDCGYNANEFLQSLNIDKTKYLNIDHPVLEGHLKYDSPTFYKNEDLLNWEKNKIKELTPYFHPNYNGFEKLADELINFLGEKNG